MELVVGWFGWFLKFYDPVDTATFSPHLTDQARNNVSCPRTRPNDSASVGFKLGSPWSQVNHAIHWATRAPGACGVELLDYPKRHTVRTELKITGTIRWAPFAMLLIHFVDVNTTQKTAWRLVVYCTSFHLQNKKFTNIFSLSKLVAASTLNNLKWLDFSWITINSSYLTLKRLYIPFWSIAHPTLPSLYSMEK